MDFQTVRSGIKTAGALASDMMEDRETRRDLVKLAAQGSGFISSIVTFVNMPETTTIGQKAVMALGVGWGTAGVASIVAAAPAVTALAGSYTIKKAAPQTYKNLNDGESFRKAYRNFLAATSIMAALGGGYQGHHLLTNAANNLMEQSHKSSADVSVPTP